MRIESHPILDFEEKKEINFTFNGRKLTGREGDSVAAALHANGVKVLAHSLTLNRPRGFYCAIGNCSSCMMVVDGVPNVKTCVTELKEGMCVQTQEGRGIVK